LEHLAGWADSTEWAVTLMRRLASGRHEATGPEWVHDSLMWPKYLARSLLSRGHVQEAYRVYLPVLKIPDQAAAWFGFSDPLFDLGFLGVMSPDTVTAIMERNRRVWPTKALAWAYFQRDTLFLLRLASEAATVTTAPSDARIRGRAQYQKGVADAYLSLVRGDSAAGLRALQAMPDSLCLVLALFDTCFFHKFTQARLLVAQGDDRGAATILDRDRSYPPLHVLATLERARIAERLGERNLAVESYQRVVDLWRRADPELQPYVREAQDGLARLTGER
jgi:hypothetical protein